MDIKQITPKVWRGYIEMLKGMLDNRDSLLRPTRILRTNTAVVTFEGASMPASFDFTTWELRVWSKGGKNYAGVELTIDELGHVQEIVREWARSIELFELQREESEQNG